MTGNPTLWSSASGADLFEAVAAGESIGDIIPNESAVYIWKLNLKPNGIQLADGAAYTDWLDSICSSPQGRILDIQLSHYLRIAEIEIRGRGLPTDKRVYFSNFLQSSKARRWMTVYLAGLDSHLPAIYVGETDNLHKRTLQHIHGESSFGSIIGEQNTPRWDQLRLHYCVVRSTVKDKASAARKSLEYVTACATLAGYTKRPG